jgi:hypothetical protein
MLRKKKIFGPKKKELVLEGVREIHNDLHTLYSSHIVRVIKSVKIGWVGHVACISSEKYIENFVEKIQGKRPLRRCSSR